jgi:hypothetical protein
VNKEIVLVAEMKMLEAESFSFCDLISSVLPLLDEQTLKELEMIV